MALLRQRAGRGNLPDELTEDDAMSAKPLSAAELCDAVRNGRALDQARLDRILALDAPRGLVEVQGATAWTSIAHALRPGDERTAAVRTTMPTVGESLSRNAAGPDGCPAVEHVQSLAVVTPAGELRRASRNRDAELFSLVVGGQGLFGTIYSVSLRIDKLARAVEHARQPERLLLHPGRHSRHCLELLVPPQALDPFLRESDRRCSDWRIPLASVELRRTACEADSFLRWASRDFAEVKLNFSHCEALGIAVRSAQLRRELIDAAIAAGGRFHIASTLDATREQAESCYPQLAAFLAHKRRFDPQERLVNPWYRHQRSLLGRPSCEVRWAN
jgi:FAD/FMN-containing dehydrogenase